MGGLTVRAWLMLAVVAVLGLAAAGGQTWRLDTVKADLGTAQAALSAAREAIQQRDKAIAARDAAAVARAAGEAQDAAELASITKGTARAAFQAGYASRRCAPGEPVGVRDLRDLWQSGAFTGDLPGQPGG